MLLSVSTLQRQLRKVTFLSTTLLVVRSRPEINSQSEADDH